MDVTPLQETYFELESALKRLESDTDPSELHGTLGGLLCANNQANVNSWISSIFPETAQDNPSIEELRTALGKLFEATRQQLSDPLCSFDLLLPGDDYGFEQQLLALGDWCQGFLIGLNLGGVEDFNRLQGEVQEFAQDMVEIARAGVSYEFSDDEEDQQAFAQLVEYIRVGVMLVNEELNSRQLKPEAGPTLH